MGGRGALERRRHEQGERVTGPSYIISATGGGGGEGERGGDQQPTRMAITAVHLRLGNSLREEGAPGPPLLRQSESKAMPVFEVRDFPRGGVGRVHDDTGLVFSVSRNAAGQDCLEVVSSQDGAGWRMQACDGGGVASRRSQSGCASLASCTEAKSSELSAADTWCARSGRRRSTGTSSTGVASCPRLSSTGSLPPISSEGAVIETRGIRHPAAVGARTRVLGAVRHHLSEAAGGRARRPVLAQAGHYACGSHQARRRAAGGGEEVGVLLRGAEDSLLIGPRRARSRRVHGHGEQAQAGVPLGAQGRCTTPLP